MPLDKTPWTDETVMPWGAHEGKKLSDVPPSYLLWLYEQPWIREWPGLYAYLKDHEDLLIAEREETTDPEHTGGYSSYDEFREDFRGF